MRFRTCCIFISKQAGNQCIERRLSRTNRRLFPSWKGSPEFLFREAGPHGHSTSSWLCRARERVPKNWELLLSSKWSL